MEEGERSRGKRGKERGGRGKGEELEGGERSRRRRGEPNTFTQCSGRKHICLIVKGDV